MLKKRGKKIIKFTVEVEFDQDELNMDAEMWISRFIKRLSYEHKVISINIGGKKNIVKKQKDLQKMNFRKLIT